MSGDLEATKQHLDEVKLLCDTQNLMIKRRQEELGEEAEYDPDEDPHVQHIEDYEERISQLESERREDDGEQAKEVERMRRDETRPPRRSARR